MGQQQIELLPVPNQSFSVRLDSDFYSITLKATNGVMACDITRGNEILQTGMRVVAGTPLIPIPTTQDDHGNFIIITQNDDIPYYDKFGITQFLIYVSKAEQDAIVAQKNLDYFEYLNG